MGKSKNKSKSKNNEKTGPNKDQTEKTISQVDSASGIWQEQSVSDSSDLNKSTVLEKDESKTKNVSNREAKSSRSSRENKEESKDRGNSTSAVNSQSSVNNRNNGPIILRRSEPDKRKNKEGEEDRRDRQKRSSLNENASNKRMRDDSNSRNNYKSSRDQYGEFRLYNEEFRSHRGNIDYTRVEEKVQDLFEMPKSYSLAHCVAEDMNMGSGIAVQFRRDFKKVDELLNQRQGTGGLAILEDKGRFIYYLVTKRYSYGKPDYSTLFSSLQKLKQHIIENDVKQLAIPTIGCGLDRLEWTNVKFMVEFLFRDVDIEIVVCMLEPTEDSPQKRVKNCKVSHETYPIHEIERGTVIIYFSSEEGEISEEMNKLDEKFNFLREFRLAGKRLGSVIFFNRDENYLLCGCIVRKSKEALFDYEAFQKCLSNINRENRKYQFYYYAFQAFEDRRDVDINYKITNVLRNSLNNIEVYVCWPGDLQKLMSFKGRNSSGTIDSTLEKSNYDEEKNSTRKSYSNNDNRRSSNSYRRKNEKEDNWNDKKISRNQSNWRSNNDSCKGNTGSFHQSNEDNWNDETSSRNQAHWGSNNDSCGGNTGSFHQANEKNWDDDYKREELGRQPSNVQENTSNLEVGFWDDDRHQNEIRETDTPSRLSTEIMPHRSKTSSKFLSEASFQNLSFGRYFSQPEIYNKYYIDWSEDKEPAKPIQSNTSAVKLVNWNPEVPSFQPRGQIEQSAKVDPEPPVEKNASEDPDGFEQFKKELDAKKINLSLIKQYDVLPKSIRNYSRVCFGRDDLITEKGVPEGIDITPSIGTLLNQNPTVGNITYVKEEERNYFYFLITNRLNTSANLLTVFLAVQKLYEHVVRNSVKCLVVPKMDTTKDAKFDCQSLKYVFQFVFRKSCVEIVFVPCETVHNEKFLNQKFANKLVHSRSAIHQMKEKCIIVYLASLDGYVNKEMNSLAKKFNNTNFFVDFKNRIKNSTDDLIRDEPNKDYVLFGCLVRKTSQGQIDFGTLQKCMQKIDQENQKVNFPSVGIQAVEISDDDSASLKVATVMLHTLRNVTITMCWPGNLKSKMPPISSK